MFTVFEDYVNTMTEGESLSGLNATKSKYSASPWGIVIHKNSFWFYPIGWINLFSLKRLLTVLWLFPHRKYFSIYAYSVFTMCSGCRVRAKQMHKKSRVGGNVNVLTKACGSCNKKNTERSKIFLQTLRERSTNHFQSHSSNKARIWLGIANFADAFSTKLSLKNYIYIYIYLY